MGRETQGRTESSSIVAVFELINQQMQVGSALERISSLLGISPCVRVALSGHAHFLAPQQPRKALWVTFVLLSKCDGEPLFLILGEIPWQTIEGVLQVPGDKEDAVGNVALPVT